MNFWMHYSVNERQYRVLDQSVLIRVHFSQLIYFYNWQID